MEKLERDGKVAVLYSPGYGAGWSSWNSENKDTLAMDKDIAQAVLEGDLAKAEAIAKEKCPDAYMGGAHQLKIHWVPKGTAFIITEYDGNEGIEFVSEIEYQVA